MSVWLFIVFLFYPVHLLKPIDIRCPDISQWKLKEKAFCNKSEPDYYCLPDENNKNYTEFCKNGSGFIQPGNKFILIGELTGKLCSNDFFQPFKFWSNYSSECVLTKSNCSEEGQINFSNGNTTSDRACRCDNKKGYAFVHKPNKECFCYPEYEDCSCYYRSCGEEFVLTSEYQCEKTSNYTGNYKCTQPDKELTRGKQQVEVKLSSLLKHRCFWCKFLDGKDTDHNSSKKEDIKMLMGGICALVVIMCLSMTGYCLLFPTFFKTEIRHRSKRNFEDTLKRRIKANYYDIITTMDYEAVTNYLKGENILNDDDLRNISAKCFRRKDKNQELLQKLWRGNQVWLDQFMHALQNIGYAELVNRINETSSDTLEKCEGDLSDDDDGNQNIPQYNRELNTRYIHDWLDEDKSFSSTTASIQLEEIIKQKNCVLIVGDSGQGLLIQPCIRSMACCCDMVLVNGCF